MTKSLPQQPKRAKASRNKPVTLSEFSVEERPWAKHRSQADFIEDIYVKASPEWMKRYSSRIQLCSQLLEYGYKSDRETGSVEFKFKRTSFCRVRYCPVCQWRRSLKWRARFLEAAPKIGELWPKARWIFVTLTVRNCPTSELRATVQHMAKSWQRLTQRKSWPATGWIRALEVTKDKHGNSHPHYHALLMVPSTYFNGKYYLSQTDWQQLWKEAARLDYNPVVDIRAVKGKEGRTPFEVALTETAKYTVKPDEAMADGDWLITLTEQMHKLRAITVGGVLKDLLRDDEPEPDENEPDPDNTGGVMFQYSKRRKDYEALD